MRKEVLETLYRTLVAQRDEVKKTLESFATKDPLIKDNYNINIDKEPAYEKQDYAEKIEMAEPLKYSEESLEKRLQELNEAIEHIESGAYGKCDNCRVPI